MIAADTVRLVVAGAGPVGATFAWTLLLAGLTSDIVRVDADRAPAGPRARTPAAWMQIGRAHV